MPDDRIYDAINIFKYSRTGQGNADIGGDASYRLRYRRLAQDVIAKLWNLWSADEISFAHLPPNLIGDSQPNRPGADIRVSTQFEPSDDPDQYVTAAEQGRLAACSSNLAHEATHLVRHFASYPEEEVLCRTIQLFYFRELKDGRTYRSRFAGVQCTAAYLPATPRYAEYQSRLVRLASQDLIDNVFNIRTYRRDLETAPTASFIARSFDWWGGLSNRWPSTKGYYLRSLASQSSHDYAYKVLEVLESITPAQWPAAKSCAGDLGQIRRALRAGGHLYNIPFTNRVSHVQRTLGENFGVRSAANQ